MSGLHIGTDFRKFLHGKLPPLALTAIILLPLLFGGLFVWSYWDPLGNLYKLPVALVNSDEGENGQEVVDAARFDIAEALDDIADRLGRMVADVGALAEEGDAGGAGRGALAGAALGAIAACDHIRVARPTTARSSAVSSTAGRA